LNIPGSLANIPAVNAAGSGRLDPSGFTGGVQAGYNWQAGKTVFGVEADFNAFNLKSSRTTAFALPFGGFPGGVVVGSSIATDWLFTARGRIGWAASNALLIYVTGGLAMANLKVGNSYTDFAIGGGVVTGIEAASANSLRTGWTIGGGLEWALNRNWSVKAEYLYVDLGSASVSGNITAPILVPTIANPIAVSTDLTAHIARVGVNYRFGGPVVARY
jgi:outer membrane immunogenic protein